MYLAPEGDELEIASAAGTFLAAAMPITRLHGTDPSDMPPVLREELGQMGWFALAVPENAGGSGLSAVEHTLFFREVGRQCGPIDLLVQCLAANTVANDDIRRDIMAGSCGLALALPDGDGFRLIGHPDADYGLLVTRDETVMVALAGATSISRPALDPANSFRVVSELPAAIERNAGGLGWRLGQLGAAAMLVGIAEASLDLISEYAKVRETFGRKIGSWQAVRHACADMAVRADAARAQLWYAAAAMKEGRGDADTHLAAAKHLANLAASANADSNIQLHGGIGVTDEHNAHLMMKHTLLLSRIFGTKRGLLAELLHARLDD